MKSKCHESKEDYSDGLCHDCYYKYIYLRKLALEAKGKLEIDKERLSNLKININKSLRIWSDVLLVADNKDRKEGCQAIMAALTQIKEEIKNLGD